MQEIKELQKQKASKVLVTITYANGKKLSVELDPAVFVECLMEAGSFDEEVFD
jgi:protein-disulfide isomerase